MTYRQWATVTRPKVAGAWHLHAALPSLDFFIALSSVAAIIGNRGQSAYAAANCYLDSLVALRNSTPNSGRNVVLDLAAVSDTGYLAENEDRRAEVVQQVGGEAVTINEAEILALLTAAVTGRVGAVCGEPEAQVVTGLKLTKEAVAGDSVPFWANDSKFARILATARSANGDASGGGANSESPGALLTKNGANMTPQQKQKLVQDALLAKTASLLMLPREALDDPTKDTVFYGLDSLVSIELRNWITREFGAALQILDVLGCGSFVALAELVLKKREGGGK